MAWSELLVEATGLYNEEKYFEAIQKINAAFDGYCPDALGIEGAELLKKPQDVISEKEAKLSSEQKHELCSLFTIRGDILVGLGAKKRAAQEYTCAVQLSPGDAVQAKLKAVTENPEEETDGKVPVTVITGFLGSGKTTLVNRILQEHHGKRIAVIENEFGEVGIDDALVRGGQHMEEENIVEMNNGCICCTVRGDLIAGLKKICRSQSATGRKLDGILIETTGLADPAPVAQTFFADDFVQRKCRLDGILTLVDSFHIIQHLDEEKPEGVENEAVEQLAFADRVLLNKIDLATEEELQEVERRIRMINATVQIQRCQQSSVPMEYILGIKAFKLD